jgi:hypothetical protein
MLWLRSLVTGESKPLPGTDGATFPFWSPDSRSIGFFSEERLNRIDVDGGALTRLARAPVGTGGTWSREGVILFTLVPDGPLVRMPASGGPTAILPGWNPLKGGYRFPQFLPDGRHFLFYMAEPSVRGVYIGSLESAERQRLIDTDSAATFASPGWLFFVRAGTLFAQRFDETTLTLGTGPVALVKGIAVDSSGVASVSASNAGALAYRVGNVNRQRQLVWFDRTGAQLGDPFPIDNENALNPAISPDGRRLSTFGCSTWSGAGR